MQVFISWSGETSKELAGVLERWLPQTLQAWTVFVSTGLPRGALWGPNLALELEKSQAGLLCLVPDSMHSPWLLFEAGALGMGVKGRPVFGVLFGVDEADAPDPMKLFQLSPFSEGQFFRVVERLNKLSGAQALPEMRLRQEFERNWPELKRQVEPILQGVRGGIPRRFASKERAKRPRPREDADREFLGCLRARNAAFALLKSWRTGRSCTS